MRKQLEMIDPNRNSYNSIFKATGLFGGVKVFQILINIARSKLIAMLIGPAGMGIAGLLQSTTTLVSQVTGCGLGTSAVRDISKASSENKQNKIDTVLTVLRKLVWITGLLGTAVVFFTAKPLSYFAFGNYDYTISFKYVSIVLLLMQLNVGQVAILQGTYRYRDMAKASLFGSLASLIVVFPIYYFLREDGIALALIVSSVCTVFFSWLYSRRINTRVIHLSIREFIKTSNSMVTLGASLALATTFGTLSGYLFNIFLSAKGDVTVVGLYQAAFQIANSYVLLVFSAMSTDYIPRLSAMSGDDDAQTITINRQLVMVLLLITPLLTAMMVFSKTVVVVLYSQEFILISEFLVFIMVGMVFRAVSFCMSYALISRGDSKLFLICEISCSCLSLALNIVGYLLDGFRGLGVAYVLSYIFYSLILYLVSNRNFNFFFSKESRDLLIKSIIIVSICLFVSIFLYGVWKCIIGILVILVASVFSFTELQTRIDFKRLIQRFIKR